MNIIKKKSSDLAFDKKIQTKYASVENVKVNFK